jgi:ATP-dependent Clp protease, protease subunit
MKKFWQFKNKAQTEADLLIYGDIGDSFWNEEAVTAKQFKQDLEALGDITQLNIFINSGGGSVWEGQAIYSQLKRFKAKKTVYIDGIAASIASVIAMAGDKIIMPRNAMLMIHRAWSIAMGNAEDFRTMANTLEKVDETIMPAYSRSMLTVDEIKEKVEAETWMTAAEALDWGFIDEIEEEKQVAASIDNGFLTYNGVKIDLSKYKNTPKIIVAQKNSKQTEKREVPLFVYEKLAALNEKRYKEEL